MSACSLFERITVIENEMDPLNLALPVIAPGGPGPGGTDQQKDQTNGVASVAPQASTHLERDYYGCYCLKFIVKNGTHITEDKVQQDFGQFGEVVDVRGPGLFSGLRGNHVYVRFIDRVDAEEAQRQLALRYHQLTPASISDVLPDNYGLYTISFYNKTGIPSTEVRKEFSNFGEVKNLTGSLDVKGGRVFVSYKEKASAVQALQAFFFRKDRYPNMKFALPRCEKDYFGCYCLKFYNKSGDVTEDKVHRDFGQFGEVVDVRGPGLFDVTGDDVYVRYKDKSSAEQALIELVGKYDSLCLAPPSDIQADKFGYFTITFVNDKCLSKSDVWYIFSKFGTVACVNGTFDCKKGRVFVSYKEKQGALNALETMLITKEYHLQVSKNSTVRKNDYNVVGGGGPSSVKDPNGDIGALGSNDFGEFIASNGLSNGAASNGITPPRNDSAKMLHQSPAAVNGSGPINVPAMLPPALDDLRVSLPPAAAALPRDHSLRNSREQSLVPSIVNSVVMQLPPAQQQQSAAAQPPVMQQSNPHVQQQAAAVSLTQPQLPEGIIQQQQQMLIHPSAVQPQQHFNRTNANGLVKFNRNVEIDIFGYFCLSFLNEDGDISEKKVRHDFGKFGEVVSVRGALGKQKGHVFVRFRRKEAAENCLNCLNSFPLSEMSELFGKYLFLSPATPRDIDCDMYGLYSISFLNLNLKTFREIRGEFAKFGEIVRLTTGAGGNTDELVSISYAEKASAVKALQTHFTNKEFPYLDIAKGSSLLLVNSNDSSDTEQDNEADCIMKHVREMQEQDHHAGPHSSDPFHEPPGAVGAGGATANGFSGGAPGGAGSDVVDELLKPFQSYFNIYRTGQYHSLHGDEVGAQPIFQNGGGLQPTNPDSDPSPTAQQRSPDKKYKIKSVKNARNSENAGQQQQLVNGTGQPDTLAFPEKPKPASSSASTTSSAPTPTSSSITPASSSTQSSPERELAERPQEQQAEHKVREEIKSIPVDMLGYYSLAFPNRNPKDLTERKVRLDFGPAVARVRGLAWETVIVSFEEEAAALAAGNDPCLLSTEKYPELRVAPTVRVIPDRDGVFAVEFGNSGMSGIREITTSFSRHGEVVSVMAGGAKNAIKRMTVSFATKEAALEAVKANAKSKDYAGVDFSRDCLLLDDDDQIAGSR